MKFSLFSLLLQPASATVDSQLHDEARRALSCKSQTQPNPIAATYPTSVTGTLNGTLAVLPIPLQEAQRIVGPNYNILTAAYRELLPDFPADMYPAIIQAVQDTDVQMGAVSLLPDFSRFSIEYPFIDVLNDSYSSFRWAPVQALSADSPALAGSAAYGTEVYPAVFDPPCDAYAASASPAGTTHFDARVNATLLSTLAGAKPAGAPAISTSFTTAKHEGSGSSGGGGGGEPLPGPIPLSFYQNITNQPSFADASKGCDNMLRFFNTSLSAGAFTPVGVEGAVSVVAPFFPGGKTWEGVWGVRIATAFIENNWLPCESLKGYSGTGPGD